MIWKEEEGTWKPREEGIQISRLVTRKRDQGERRLKRNLIWQLGTTGVLPQGRFSGIVVG